jgi:hypothetical protein
MINAGFQLRIGRTPIPPAEVDAEHCCLWLGGPYGTDAYTQLEEAIRRCDATVSADRRWFLHGHAVG